jgi:hypothetical protein
MLKRGQITIFLVVGIVILFLFAGSVFMFSTLKTKEVKSEAQDSPEILYLKPQISSYVENCLYDTVVPGIYLLGIQGGVIYPEDPSSVLLTESTIINYGFLQGVDQFSIEDMEEQIDMYIEENLDLCIDEFSVYTSQGLVISGGEVEAESLISMDRVIANIEYEVEVTQDNDEFTLKSFSTTVSLPVGLLVEEARRISGGGLISSDYFVTTFPFDSSRTIYSISDENSVIENAPFTFMFAIMNDVNTAPSLSFIPNTIATLGEVFTYQLHAVDPENDILTFAVDPPLFSITNGFINETLTETGNFDLDITVTDIHGLSDTQQMRLIVDE